MRFVSAEARFTQYAQSKRQTLENSTLRRLTQRPSSVQLWQTPAGRAHPKVPRPGPSEDPDEAQEASYFAAPARTAIFSPISGMAVFPPLNTIQLYRGKNKTRYKKPGPLWKYPGIPEIQSPAI
jgi:hypothetical protein